MKNVVECYKHFFGYSNALETHGAAVLGIKKNVIDVAEFDVKENINGIMDF